MSKTKNKKFGILILIAMFALLLFGCGDKEIGVNSIGFNFEEDEQVVMVVGQSFELNENIEVLPADATNKTYQVVSLDGSIIAVEGSKISAVKEGSTYIKIVSNDNETLQDVIKVSVKEASTKLISPKNLRYNNFDKTLSFNAVEGASSYTIKINDKEYALGNSTSFDLTSEAFDQELYDNLLNVKVKANPSKYAFAYTSSDYTAEEECFKIYQVAPAGNVQIKAGILSFERIKTTTSTISIQNKKEYELTNEEKEVLLSGQSLPEGETLSSKSSATGFDLNSLDEKYLGTQKQVYVATLVDEQTKEKLGENVNYYNSIVCTNLNVLPSLNITITDYLVAWSDLKNVDCYKIFIDGQEKTIVNENKFDLLNLRKIEDYEAGEIHSLKIEPVIGEDCLNTAKTSKEFAVQFSRLESVQLKVDELASGIRKSISWNAVSNADTYYLTSSFDNKTVSLKTTQFSLENYTAGNYNVSVVASKLGEVDGVYYIPSLATPVQIEKVGLAQISIENYNLKISKAAAGDVYSIKVAGAQSGQTIFETTKSSDGEVVLVPLNQNYTAGEYIIEVTKLNTANASSITGDATNERFVQLEAIDDLEISGGVTELVRSDINKNANICLSIREKDGTVLYEEIDANSLVYEYQTTEHLNPGEYVVSVYVKGNGSSTFSVRELGQEVATAEYEFMVLDTVNLEVKDNSKTEIYYGGVFNSLGYAIYKGKTTPEFVTKQAVGMSSYVFELADGQEETYYVQAVGNNSNILSSDLSNPIVVSRLNSPTLVFDNEFVVAEDKDKNSLSMTEVDNADSYKLFNNGQEVNYAFDGSAYTGLENENNFKLFAIAPTGKTGEVYYINSLPYELKVDKIATVKAEDIIINSANQLIIKAEDHAGEYNLQLSVNVNGTETVFYGGNGTLTSAGKTLTYTYNQNQKLYTINLVGADYKEIVEGMSQYGFAVKVRFIKESQEADDEINSEYSESGNYQFVKIDSASVISINADNELVIEPTNQDRDYYLRLTLILKDKTITLAETNTNVLSGGGYELPFRKTGDVYLVDLLEDLTYVPLIDGLADGFSVKVSYSFHAESGQTDLDGVYTEEIPVAFANCVTLQRNGQAITFVTADATYTYDYYKINLNGTELPLYTVVPVEGVYSLNIDDFYSNYKQWIVNGVNELKIITKNKASREDPLLLSVISESFNFRRENELVFVVTKDNNSSNNSLVVQSDAFTTEYDKKYIFEFFNEDKTTMPSYDGETVVMIDNQAQGGKLLLNVDDYVVGNSKFNKRVYISARIETEGNYQAEKDVYVFDSFDTEVVKYEIITAPLNLKIESNVLTFGKSENAVGYEVYIKNGNTYEENPINTSLILTNSYNITGIVGRNELVVKAIADVGYSNSTYSSSVGVIKMAKPTVSISGGDFLVSYGEDVNKAITDNGAVVKLVVNNRLYFDLSRSDDNFKRVSDTSILIMADKLLKYNASTITNEDLTFKIVVERSSLADAYYINSDTTEYAAAGLFGPSNIKKTNLQQDAETVENLMWNLNTNNFVIVGQNNVEISVGYELMVTYVYDDQTYEYTSMDSGLKFRSSRYEEYGVITGTRALFPVGYDKNGDGILDIAFEQGSYKIQIRTLPQSGVQGYNLCASDWSPAYEFKILTTPVMTTYDGCIVWEREDGVEKYEIRLYQNGVQLLNNSEIVTENIYRFDNPALTASGLIDVEIKATSSKENVLNSATSAKYSVYRVPEPEAQSLKLEDGGLVLSAVKYFTRAKFEFYSPSTGTIERYFDNTANSLTFMDGLTGMGIYSWNNVSAIQSKLQEVVEYHIPEDVVDIPSGYSYTINVTLLGTTSQAMGVVNSAKEEQISDLQTTKTIPVTFDVSAGVLKFGAKEGSYDDSTFNYNYNEQTGLANFWNTAFIYKVVILHSNTTHTIFVLDYYKFTNAISSFSSTEYQSLTGLNDLCYYVKMGDIIFNVYKDNKINFADYDKLYYYETNEEDYIYSSTGNNKSIDLNSGGSFLVNVYFLGGDSYSTLINGSIPINAGYLTSKSCDLEPFVRYGVNSLSSYEGKVQFENKLQRSIVDGRTVIDYPVYRLTISQLNDASIKQIVYMYSAQLGLTKAKEIAKKNDLALYNANKIIFEQIAEDVETETALTFDMSRYFESGNYNVTAKTLAGLGVDGVQDGGYLLNAKTESKAEVYKKLTGTQFTIGEDGSLRFDLSYVSDNWINIYKKNYEISIRKDGDANEFVYEIDENSEGVEVIGGTELKYVIPREINFNGQKFSTSENTKYKIKVRALTGENFIINGTYLQVTIGDGFVYDSTKDDYEFEFVKSAGVEWIRIEQGQLRWKVANMNLYKNLVANIINEKDGAIMVVRTTGTPVYDANSTYLYHYDNLDSLYYIGKESEERTTKAYIEAGNTYSLKAYVAGNKDFNLIDSNVSQEVRFTRLAKVDPETVVTTDGILTWSQISGATKYQVLAQNETTSTTYVFYTDTNSLAVEDVVSETGEKLPVGNYKIQVKAVGSNVLTGLTSGEVEGFTRIDGVTNVRLVGDNIVWNENGNAEGYKVRFEYTGTNGPVVLEQKLGKNETSIAVPTNIVGTFEVKVNAIGLGSGKLLNSDWSTFGTTVSSPKPVETVTLDKTTFTYSWQVTEDFNKVASTEDKLIVEYTFVKYIATGKLPAETRTVEIKPNADYSNKNYSYKLTEIGEYTNFSVRVSRKGTAASAKVSGEKPGDLDFVFDIYAYGLGVDGDLYGIKTVEHLSNIKYYPSAKFELGGNVNIETLFTSIESSGSALICEEFTGYLNGNGNALRFGENVTQYNLNLQNVTNIALFKKLNGATIENISYGEETLTVNIVDEFSISEELKLALIAQEAVHATMKQVSIKNVNITVLTQGVTIANRIKIAGMFAESNSATNIQNCHVGLTVNMQADFDSNFNVYIASTVATAQNTTIGYTTANFALTSSVYKQLYAVGGLVAEMTATTTGYGVHDSSSVEVDIDNVVAKSVGGVVGRTSSVTVTNCTVSGTIKYTNIDYKIDIGGIVGIMDASTVTSCTVNINFEITVYASQSQYLGVIAGNTGANSTIEKCATTVKPCGQRTTISNGVVNYGIYGYKGSGSNVGTITIK